MRALVIICVLLAGCTGTAEKSEKLDVFSEPLNRTITGVVTPKLYFMDKKFPLFIVELNGQEYSLEGYGEPPGQDRPKYFFALQNAREFLEGETLACRETRPWHLVCFNADGENMRKYLEPKPLGRSTGTQS